MQSRHCDPNLLLLMGLLGGGIMPGTGEVSLAHRDTLCTEHLDTPLSFSLTIPLGAA
jgi:hypothetical protein